MANALAMKKLFQLLVLLLTVTATAQDGDFFETLTAIKTPDEARTVADNLAAKLNGNYIYYKQKEFDHGLLRFVYVPEGMTEEQIKAQGDYEDSFVADFKVINDPVAGKTYRFEMAKARYDALFPAWKHWFKTDAAADKKVQRITNADKGYQYSFMNRGEVWVIGR